MNRVEALNQRYAAAAALAANGVEIVAVGDPAGAQLNAAVRRLLFVAGEEGPGLWDDLVGAARALRWRLMTQPQPLEVNPAVREAAAEALRQVRRLRGAVANDALLDDLSRSIAAVQVTDPAIGDQLTPFLDDHGPHNCVVVAASRLAQNGMATWLTSRSVRVLTVGELEREQSAVTYVIVVGPPRFFHSSLVTAPVSGELTFLVSAWFQDRSVPRSALSGFADGAIRVASRVRTSGDVSEPEAAPSGDGEAAEAIEDFLPQPSWGSRRSEDRPPRSDEVEARKLLLSGNWSMWLDDGERIRSLDPRQPVGERVTYVDVPAVRPGTYLLLRQGETERTALYQAALGRLGARGAAVEATQRAWKEKLHTWVGTVGHRTITEFFRTRGIKAADRVRAWTEPNLVRPHSDQDFERLLEWLQIPFQPTFGNATLLRRAIYQASAEVREQLERAVSDADLTALARDGHLSLDVRTAGFRGIVATRVLAVAPFTEIVSRHDARVLITDRTNKWLE